ncbi:MAG: ATP-dependent RecD-like DNA helicase [Verrucomicrobiota bacterium]|nr:ATP-dependent RecD-like DNA helicase [Verrucomicrobiota bacterium]
MPLEAISGLLERVTFFNEESGFAVLRIKAKGHKELVTVVGNVPAANEGEWVTAEGDWVRDRDHGLQLKAEKISCTPPTTREGIEKYLASGLIKGIGPVYAKKMVASFGEGIFDIIEQYSARLQEIDGIGEGRRKIIKEAWAEQKKIREIMLFLHSHGVTTSKAVRIYKTYGDEAINKVRENPYILARDINGIGFKSADKIALKVGIPEHSEIRARAALSYILMEATGQGHCGLPEAILTDKTGQLTGIPGDVIQSGLKGLFEARDLIKIESADDPVIYPSFLRQAELNIADRLLNLASLPSVYPEINTEKALAWCEEKTGKVLSPSQKAAVIQALNHRLIVITGGPGVGKTTILSTFLKILTAKKVRCLLAAPTGRAARRLSDSTGHPAKTIHRLLETRAGHGFAKNERSPLNTDCLIVDEVSMVDVPLMSAVLRGLPQNAALVLVGDADQLPSVGPGMVLRNLIDSHKIPVMKLTEIFRQAAESKIITAAHAVNQGTWLESDESPTSDFFFIERESPEEIQKTILELVTKRIPEKLKIPSTDIQILCPMNRGNLGTYELNRVLQQTLNPVSDEFQTVVKFGTEFRRGDRVIQTQNNYDKDVFNGDLGTVRNIDSEENEITVSFDGKEVKYAFGDLDELILAYAMTIHKSQGSEFPAVVIPLSTQHYLMLQRNLLYTGMTRGKNLVIIVGQKKALHMSIRQNESMRRYSDLPHLLTRETSL